LEEKRNKMGDIRRKHKQYRRPKKAFDKVRIDEENVLVKRYGLKNKKEIWKADMAIRKIRNNAKKLITSSEKEKQEFIERLVKKGFKVKSIEDVLGLNKEDWLKRRLQSVLVEKKIVRTVKEARQSITHKKVMIDGKRINVPSYLVLLEEENKIQVIKPNIVPKKDEQKHKGEKNG
jgi:small subunit ribosomal protein S4